MAMWGDAAGPVAGRSHRGGSHPLLRLWAISTTLFFCLCAVWSWVMPIGSANDESAQLVKAASVVRGQIVGQPLTPMSLAETTRSDQVAFKGCTTYFASARRCSAALTVVAVPSSFGTFSIPECFIFQQVSARCGTGLRGSGRTVKATTYVGRYPPLYYAIVGLPSLLSSTDTGVYMMRLVSGLVSAIFLGLALALAAFWSRSRLLVAAVAVAASAMVLIFGSAVNPSGLECATAICVWTGGLVLVLDHADHPPRSLVAGTAVAASVMVLMRGLSPFWLALIAVSLVAVAPHAVATLLRWTRVRVAVGVTGLVGAVAAGYILWAHALSVYPIGTPVPATDSELTIVHVALGKSWAVVQELAGAFGGSETSPPDVVLALWMAAAAIVVAAGLLLSHRRYAVVLLALITGAIVLPTALMVSQARVVGVVWQARDGFPLYAGVFLVAGAVAFRRPEEATTERHGRWDEPRIALRMTAVLAVCVSAAQLVDLLWALRRYTVGLGGPLLNFFGHVAGGWSPPVPALMLALIAVVVTIAYGWWLVHLSRRSTRTRPDDPTTGPSGVAATLSSEGALGV
jgi:hypothetical protein